nr:immunoglobulin light chain junction region [Macaca mulatta]
DYYCMIWHIDDFVLF